MTPNHYIIQSIDCYGDWREDSNCVIIGTWNKTGIEFEEIYADGADTWEDAVAKLTKWASKIGITIHELQAC